MDRSPIAEAQLGVTAAATSGNSGLLYRLVAGLLDEGVALDTILFDVLLRSEDEVGSRWQTGDYLISEEHAATATVETVISMLAGAFDQPDTGRHVVVSTVEGDAHSLPARAVAASLLYHGFRAIFLGANVLASDLRQFLTAEPPDALVLSCAMTNHLLGAREAVREAHAVGVPVVVGGRGFGAGGGWARSVGADSWAGSGRQVPRLLDTWSPDIEVAEASAHDPDEMLIEMIRLRSAILASAETHLGGEFNPRMRQELELTLGAIEAAILVSDLTVLEEFVSWQRRTLDSHRLAGHEDITQSLARAIRPIAGDVADRITGAGEV